MVSKNTSLFRTPRKGVKGLGWGHGTSTKHFIGQRVTAIAAIPLCLIMIYLAYRGFFAPFEQAMALVQNPFFAISSFLFVGVVIYHMKLGMDMVLTDYIHNRGFKIFTLLKNIFFCALVASIMFYSLFKIIFSPPA